MPAAFQVAELARARFSHAVARLRVIETHISWVVLTGPFAYKIKKPVRYDFLDASTLERRRELCREELRLNRRLAPDLYMDVIPLTREDGYLEFGGAGPAVEYAVSMQQFDPTQDLATQLDAGTVRVCDVTSIATRIADFHRQADAAAPDSPLGDMDSVRDQVVDNQAVLERHAAGTDDLAALRRLGEWLQRSLADSESLIRQRKRSGAVRECHGDLHAHNIVRWKQQWTPFDCIEFNADLRWIDVVSDVAFLFMDLVAHRRRDLAYALLSRYLEDTGEYEGLPLLRLYAVYRAAVRAKVDALAERAALGNEALALRARRARRLEVAAELMTDQAPAILLTHGVTACGKSWLSERLVHGLRAVRVRSDLERKRLAGIGALADSGSGVGEKLYTPAFTDRLYARLLECAKSALAAGLKVIVDASFLRLAQREQFRHAAIRQGVPFLILSCHAGTATLHRRLEDRMRAGLDPSEANRAVLGHQLATQEPFTPDEQPHVLRVNTEAPTAIDEVVSAIDAATRCGSDEKEEPEDEG